MTPFLKWAGGKRWFVEDHSHLLPRTFNRYIEPFVGGGAVFFHLCPQQALLGDSNRDLLATYQAVKDDWDGVQRHLKIHWRCHSTPYYYQLRVRQPRLATTRAARFIYLNRSCWNGLYRVNLQGQFNVPFGLEKLPPLESLEEASQALQGADLLCGDFEVLIDQAEQGDLLFVDPPYTVRHNQNGFVKYNEVLFSWQDQERLALALARAKERGAHVVATNAYHEDVRALYAGFQLRPVKRYSSIAARAASRGDFEELVILWPRRRIRGRAQP